MNTPNSIDDIMNEMNDWAKAEGRYLGKPFWEIPSQPESILEVPLTPEAEERLALLRARRLRRSKQATAQTEPVASPKDTGEEHGQEETAEGTSVAQSSRN